MKGLNYNKKELAVLKDNYFKARALYETIKEEAETIQKNILANNEFFESEEWTERMKKRGENGEPRRILRPFDTFLMKDEDFQKYLDLCYEEYKRAGIDDKRGKEYIPEAEAKDLYWEAEKQLVLYGIEIIPDGMKEKETFREAIKNIKYKGKVLDLILRLEC